MEKTSLLHTHLLLKSYVQKIFACCRCNRWVQYPCCDYGMDTCICRVNCQPLIDNLNLNTFCEEKNWETDEISVCNQLVSKTYRWQNVFIGQKKEQELKHSKYP